MCDDSLDLREHAADVFARTQPVVHVNLDQLLRCSLLAIAHNKGVVGVNAKVGLGGLQFPMGLGKVRPISVHHLLVHFIGRGALNIDFIDAGDLSLDNGIGLLFRNQ